MKPQLWKTTLTLAFCIRLASVASAQEPTRTNPIVTPTDKQLLIERVGKWSEAIFDVFMKNANSSHISEEQIREMAALDQKFFVPLDLGSLNYLIAIDNVDHFVGRGLFIKSKFEVHNVVLKEEPKDLLSATEEFPNLLQRDVRYDARKTWLRWWLDGQERTPQWFGERYPKWLALRQEGKTTEAAAMYQKLLDIGLPAIPLWLEKLQAQPDAPTQQAITEAISSLTDGAIKPGLPVADYAAWWKADGPKWTVPFPQSRAAYITWLQQEAATNDGLGVPYATTIGHIEDPATIPALIALLRHAGSAVRAVSLEQLQKLVGEALPQPYRLPAVGVWENRSDLVDSGQYQFIHKAISEGQANMASFKAGQAAAQAIETWWRGAQATPVHWERAWADL